MDHRVVIYTNDMEPITVIELPSVARALLMSQGRVHLAVPVTPDSWESQNAAMLNYPQVTLYVESMFRHGKVHKMVFTHDEESALLLKAAFLPGQQGELGEVRAEALARGFMRALALLG